MRRYVGVIVAFTGLIAVNAILYTRLSGQIAERERDADALRIQRDYAERAGWIRANPDPKQYKEEVLTFLRWYFRQVDEHVEKHHRRPDFDDYLVQLEQRDEKGNDLEKRSEGPDPKKGDKKARYEMEKALFAQMRGGKYQPVWTATDQDMRLDILTADPKMEKGEPVIHMDLVLWGAQREERDNGKTRQMVTSATFNGKVSIFDATDKLYGEVTFDGDPSMKVDYPERFIWAFPPQTVIGYYALPQFPPEAKRVEINFNVTSRAPSGDEAMAHFVWKLDVPAEWKAASEQAFRAGAQESVRPEEEINPNGAKSAPTAKASKPKGRKK